MAESTLLDAWLSYVARSWPIHPLHDLASGACSCRTACGRNAGKHPRLRDWPRVATTDVLTITGWSRRWPTANIGVPTGAASDLAVFDVDGDVGAESICELERTHGALPETVLNLTGRGGRQHLFRHPGGHVPNAVGLWPGVDVRGDGGYIVVPPSRTVGPYMWAIGYAPEDLPLAPLPAWLLAALRRPEASEHVARPPDVWEALVKNGIAEGTRNDSLARLTGYLLRRRPAPRVVLELIRAVNQARCRPPLSDGEVERIVDSIARREAQREVGRQGRNGG